MGPINVKVQIFVFFNMGPINVKILQNSYISIWDQQMFWYKSFAVTCRTYFLTYSSPLNDTACLFNYRLILTSLDWSLHNEADRRRTDKIRQGVDFSYYFCWAKFIEKALSIFAVCRCPSFLHKFEAKKFDDTAKGRKLHMRNQPQVLLASALES